ncbi:MAG TPA: ABC transporter permease, partial [Candidatus Hodarchaeales archaeon]|nr:ABC transporter permease [Candidatus Hodarchaeales archaeon]
IGTVVVKNILRYPQRLTQLTVMLALIISFGFVISSLGESYTYQAEIEALYNVGGDFRLQLPSSNQLEYNSSLLQAAITAKFSPYVLLSPVIISVVLVGTSPLIALGIDLETLREVTLVGDFFSRNSVASLWEELAYDPVSPKVVISYSLTTIRSISVGNTNFELPAYALGDRLLIRTQSAMMNATVVDVALRFPALADVANADEDDLSYVIMDRRMMTTTNFHQNQTSSLIENSNATLLLGRTSRTGGDLDHFMSELQGYVEDNFPQTFPIRYLSFNDKIRLDSPLGALFTDMVILQTVLVSGAILVGTLVYMGEVFAERRKELGIWKSIGGQRSDLWVIVVGELLFGYVLGILLSFLVGIVVSFSYIGYLQSFFSTPVEWISLSYRTYGSLVLLSFGVIILVILYALRKVSRVEPLEVLREA